MATIPKIATLVAGFHFVLLASSTAFAQKTPDTGAPITAPMPAPAAATEGSVWVHIQGSEVAELQRDTGDHKNFETVCTSPCDQAVSSAYAYRIGGDGIRNSKVFRLRGDREVLNVDEGSKSGLVLGIVGVSVGGAALLIGCVVLLITSVVEDVGGSSSGTDSTRDLGLGLAVVGLAGVIGGAVAIGSNAHTSVTQGVPAPASAQGIPATVAAQSVPSPAWLLQDTRRQAGWARPPALSIPILSGHF